MKILPFAMIAFLLATTAARAELVIAYTSFEEPVVPFDGANPSTSYTDPGDPLVDHPLPSLGGVNMPVNYTSLGGELGFSAYYTNTHNSIGLTDGDNVGVLRDYPSLTSQILDPIDGVQQYIISDGDGKVTVTLDSVNLTGLIDPRVSVDYWLRSTSWLATDFGHIWVEIDNGNSISEITLLDTRPNDIDNLGLENRWTTVSASLPSGTIATLKFELDSTDPSRMMGVDNIRFTAVPEPSAFSACACWLILGAHRLRRRRS